MLLRRYKYLKAFLNRFTIKYKAGKLALINYSDSFRYKLNLFNMLAQEQQLSLKEAVFCSMIINVKPVKEAQEQQMDREQSLSPYLQKILNSQSTYYQTHNTQSKSPANKKWTGRKSSLPLSSSPVKDRQIIFKKMNMRASLADFQISPQHFQTSRKQFEKNQATQSHWTFSPKKQSPFRTRMIKPTLPTSLQLRPTISSQSYFAMWTDGAAGLFFCNENQRRQIASLTKIMTAYTVLSLCQQYNIKVREEWIPIHSRAHYMEGTSANLKAGEQILLIDLLYGLLLPSGNDAGIALAQYFGQLKRISSISINYQRQSIRLFVFEMNRCALRLGLGNTSFDNPTGLTNSNNFSTAKDIAKLTSVCLKNHLLRLIFRRKVHKCQVKNDKLGYNRQVVWHNTNKQLYRIRECLGVKTGITPGAGPCLSAAYRIGHKELVVVVLNCHDLQSRFEDAQNIYRWCRRQIMN